MTTRAREVEARLRELAADEEAHPYSNAGPELTEAADTISALIAECEWRDIASAPKDGTAILAFHTGFLGNHEGRDTGCVVVARNGYDRTWDIVGSGQEYEAWNLTHWRPLPPPPQPVPVGGEKGETK